MKIIHKFDEEGNWIPGETLDIYPNVMGDYEIPEGYTDVALPEPNYKPMFVNGEWVETATNEEIEESKSPVLEPDSVVLEKQNAQLSYELMLAQAELETTNQTLSDLTYQLMINEVI